MRRRKWIVLLILVLLIGLIFGAHVIKPAKLFVNGQKIPTGGHVRIRYAQAEAEIPVLRIFRTLGRDAEIRYNPEEDAYQVVIDQEYVLFSTNDASKLLGQSDAKTAVRQVKGDEFIVDTGSTSTFLYWGWEIDIDVNVFGKSVYVTSFSHDEYTETPAHLIVNGKDLSSTVKTTKREYYDETIYVIPVLAVLRELGAEVSWEADTAVTVSHPGKSYTFDLTDSSFGYDGPPGGVGVRYVEDQELYMEDSSVHYFLKEFMDAQIHRDSKTDTVRIQSY